MPVSIFMSILQAQLFNVCLLLYGKSVKFLNENYLVRNINESPKAHKPQ